MPGLWSAASYFCKKKFIVPFIKSRAVPGGGGGGRYCNCAHLYIVNRHRIINVLFGNIRTVFRSKALQVQGIHVSHLCNSALLQPSIISPY